MERTRTVTRWTTLVLCLLACVACSPQAQRQDTRTAVLSGRITYDEDVGLEANARVKIFLQDVTRTDVPVYYLDEVEIVSPGQIPIPFQVRYDPAGIRPDHVYVLLVRIYEGDRLRFTNVARYPVITYGCTNDCEIVVDRLK
jgi:putative lipoprotein